MNEFISSPYFGLSLSILAFAFGTFANHRLRSPFVNPLLVAVALIILLLNVFHIPLDDYMEGASVISLFLAPATVVLALSVYRQIQVLRRYFVPILLGCLAGAVTAMTSAALLCRAFGLGDELMYSMIPKSVTTPIAMEISRELGGIVPVTIAAVILTGILGAVFSPLLIRLFRIQNPIAAGVAIGASSHAIGTSRAIQLGEVQGAMSGLSLCVSGIITVILSLFL
ncbi:LrgB family protein [Papillibacter cinnamivorans]|uniref:TIGR00659 family protein n=1 Tax=Papillibacter cinnamivorans DSM 12816 TaxID=1122930 RepID=A0A1W1ZGE0_9FIRM|nr:LrgB family protein [Papillibacter cinnamivorans]SMC47474.1 TIGR00659 family protein [Papillibacter cinnamivorans DSM 12816]